jgi:hypothetical protein
MLMMKTAASEIAPAKAGYCSLKNLGRHGSVRETKAVGNKCTNAVAISTPVPKCRKAKRAFEGMRSCGILRATMGKAQALAETARMMNRAPTWRGRL